ncbi:MAG: hypothetical protein R3E31_02800 [Chloroflexota bacterium]
MQTARNIFRGHGPEYLDVRRQPGSIAALEQESATHQRLLAGALSCLLATAACPARRHRLNPGYLPITTHQVNQAPIGPLREAAAFCMALPYTRFL